MESLSSAPFIRILPAFIFGVTISFYCSCNPYFIFSLFFAGIAGLAFFYPKKKYNYSHRCYNGLALQLIYFSIGWFLTEAKDYRRSEAYFGSLNEGNAYIAVIEKNPAERNGNYRSFAEIISVKAGDLWLPAVGKTYVYFKSDSNASGLYPGDRIIFNNRPSAIPSPMNPGQFDFREYSSLHRIYNQVFLGKGEWSRIPSSGRHFSLKSVAEKLRDNFLHVYKEAGINGKEYAVLSALVLGYQDEIDRETMQAFSASGTLHVLSVSGMHVGIVFAALSAMLKFMERKKSLRIVRVFILLVSLWFYALLTGLSPSVIRSAMMFTFILLGKSLDRNCNIYNSLALSALCIFIFFDPLMLFEVGLQLSFLAVGGIAFLYPMIYRWFVFENKWLDKIWGLIAVSVAAQAATFALSVYYFHQFPNYFIPANLVIIPLSTIGIFSGIGLLFISPFKIVLIKAGLITKYVIYLLNESASFVEKLPGAVANNLSLSFLEMVLVYAILFLLIFFFQKKNMKYLFSLQFSIIILLVSFGWDDLKKSRQSNLVVFSSTSALNCQMNNGFESILFYHLADSAKSFQYSKDYCAARGLSLEKRKLVCLDGLKNYSDDAGTIADSNIISINNYSILFMDGKYKYSFRKEINVDLMFVDKNSKRKRMPAGLTAKEIINAGDRKTAKIICL